MLETCNGSSYFTLVCVVKVKIDAPFLQTPGQLGGVLLFEMLKDMFTVLGQGIFILLQIR